MSGNDGFQADPGAITTAATAFENEAGPIAQQAQALTGIQGAPATAGRAYAAQGTAYHDAIVTTLGALIREYSTKTGWLSGALSQTATDYTSGDAAGADTLTAAGNGA